MTRFLENRELVVQSAEHGLAALDVLATFPVDLVLSDVQMPQMTGLELLRVPQPRVSNWRRATWATSSRSPRNRCGGS